MFFFIKQGDIQQLDMYSGPEAAYDQCNAFIPDCDQPLPQKQATAFEQPMEIDDYDYYLPHVDYSPSVTTHQTNFSNENVTVRNLLFIQ